MDSVDKAPPRPRRRSVAWTVAEIIVLALAVYLLLPQLAGIERVGHRLATALWWVSMLALLLETASLLAYGELIRTALRATGRGVPHTLAFRVVLAGTALGKTLPGGTTAAMPFVIRSLHATGIRPATAAATVAGSGMISSAVLAALLPLAVLVSVVGGDGRGMAPEGIALALVTAAAVAGVFALLRDPATVARVVRRGVRLASHGPLRRRLGPGPAGRSRRSRRNQTAPAQQRPSAPPRRRLGRRQLAVGRGRPRDDGGGGRAGRAMGRLAARVHPRSAGSRRAADPERCRSGRDIDDRGASRPGSIRRRRRGHGARVAPHQPLDPDRGRPDCAADPAEQIATPGSA